MKTLIRIFTFLSILLLLTASTLLATQHNVGAPPASIQAVINASSPGDTVNLSSGTYNQTVVISQSLVLIGDVGGSTIITPPSGNGITVAASDVMIKALTVTGAPGNGISANGVSNLRLKSVHADGNTGSGAQLTNVTGPDVTKCTFSNNSDEGFNAQGGSNFTMLSDTASTNGAGANGSGFNLKGVTGTSTVTGLVAVNNHVHGLSVGDGATGVTISGGNFTGNGTAGDAATGGGINFIAMGTSTTSAITLDGVVNSSNNTTAGIYIYSDNASTAVNTVAIGATGSITLSNNGSSNATYSGGAGVLIYGIVSGVSIANTTFIKGAAPGDGIMNLGDGTQAGSPSGTQVAGCTFIGYTSVRPAVTLADSAGGHPSPPATNDVTATNCTFNFVVNAKVFLEGPFSAGEMTTTLQTSSYVPTTQPYPNSPPFNHSGTENVGAVPANVVDWILLELRTGTAGNTKFASRACFLMMDGTVADTNASAGVNFAVTLATGYHDTTHYLVVRHRNHLPIMSANAVPYPTAYDFTTDQSQAYGSGSPMKALPSSKFGMYTGDANRDGFVTSDDFAIWLVALTAGASGYDLSDFDFNGFVTSDDFAVWLVNLTSGAGSLVP